MRRHYLAQCCDRKSAWPCRIPYFIDGDIKMTESLAILYYLLEKYGTQQHACSSAWQYAGAKTRGMRGVSCGQVGGNAHLLVRRSAAGNGKLEPAKSDIFNRAQFYEVTPTCCWLCSNHDKDSIGFAVIYTSACDYHACVDSHEQAARIPRNIMHALAATILQQILSSCLGTLQWFEERRRVRSNVACRPWHSSRARWRLRRSPSLCWRSCEGLPLATHCSRSMHWHRTMHSLTALPRTCDVGSHNLRYAAARYPDNKKDPVVAEYMKTGALKACDEIETRFFGDGRAYVAGPDFTAAGGVPHVLGSLETAKSVHLPLSHASLRSSVPLPRCCSLVFVMMCQKWLRHEKSHSVGCA